MKANELEKFDWMAPLLNPVFNNEAILHAHCQPRGAAASVLLLLRHRHNTAGMCNQALPRSSDFIRTR